MNDELELPGTDDEVTECAHETRNWWLALAVGLLLLVALMELAPAIY